MANRFQRIGIAAFALLLILPAASPAADSSARWLDIEFPRDSPVLPVTSNLGLTTARVQGASMVLDLHASLLLRNTGTKSISGLTLRVEAQDITPSGKGSITIPSLRVEPGEVFPVRIDMELSRPFNAAGAGGAIVQVSLDCALFSDLSSYGPDQLQSRRALIVYELEARRDRTFLTALLQTGKLAQLREELNFGLQDLTPQQLGLELLRAPGSARARQQALTVGAVAFPSSPVKALGGAAQVEGSEVSSPEVELRNTSRKAVRTIDMGWIVRDERGRQYVAGSVPAALELQPIETGRMTEPGTLRFSHLTGQPMSIDALLTFIKDVEFADGKMWIPTRVDIDQATSDPMLRRALANSPEEQRLSEIYRHKGMSGLSEELRKGK
ncbi:MAG TPA: hypothetical protein VLI55_18490 [Bryobacteraceae bacterium]|nr:hypothetical protein [Bryobacteraceae bacterium]